MGGDGGLAAEPAATVASKQAASKQAAMRRSGAGMCRDGARGRGERE